MIKKNLTADHEDLESLGLKFDYEHDKNPCLNSFRAGTVFLDEKAWVLVRRIACVPFKSMGRDSCPSEPEWLAKRVIRDRSLRLATLLFR